MATRVDAKLLKQTKFPLEFNQKVDMSRVNIEVMKKWIAGKLSELLGSEDDVVIELCFNLLEGSRFPDIKSLQIQLTGFLDKDTPKFCKELWNLCLSAQENPQGVPKELLEAKKLELRQEKLDAEKAAQEARRRKEQERAREREVESLRQKERAERARGWRSGGRGGREHSRRDFKDSRSPTRRRSRDRYRDHPPRRDVDSYVPAGARPSRWAEGRGRRLSRSRSLSRMRSASRTPPRRSRHMGRERSRERRRPRSYSRSPSHDRRGYGRDRRRSPDYGDARARSRSYSSGSPTPRRNRRGNSSASSRSRSRSPAPKIMRRRRGPSPSRSKSRSASHFRSRSSSSSRELSGRDNRRRRPSSHDPKADKRELRADVGKGRKSRDDRRLSRSRDRSRNPKRRSRDRSKSRSIRDHGHTRTRSLTPRRDRSRSRSPSRRRDRKRRRSIERYAPVARRRRNTSSVSAPETYSEICPRSETVEILARILNEHGVIHVRGTPASGKTTLATLLHSHLRGTHRVVFIDRWKVDVPATQFLVEKCHELGHKQVREDGFLGHQNNNIVFIIDEAQVTYNDSHLWYTVIKSRIGLSSGPRFCLFTSYGSPTTGSPDYPASTTPPMLHKEQRVSLVTPSNSDAPGICLFYNLFEFGDVINRFCQNPTIEFSLAKELQHYVFSLTNGHPGMVSAILKFISKLYRHHLKRADVREITFNHIRDDLENDRKLFKFLELEALEAAGRSLPSRQMLQGALDPDIVAVLLHTLRDGSVEFTRKNPAMVRCFRLGFLHAEELTPGQVICVLPSTLHARYVEYYYGQPEVKPPLSERYPNIHTLGLKVLQRFSKALLHKTRDSRRLGPSGRLRPPETAFKDEFYRSFWNEAGAGTGISSEWSGTSPGRIDFHIIQPGWGFEFLHDGDRLKERCNRFCLNGAYYPWVQRGRLTDWLILDCRHSYPGTTYSGQPKLWRVVFADDYSWLHILDCENQEVVPKIHLAN